MLPWTVGLFAVALGLWLLDRRRARQADAFEPRWLPVAISVLAFLAAAGTVQQVVRVGHAGAEATWSGVVPTSEVG